MRIVRTLFMCLALIGAGAFAIWTIFQTEPVAEREGAVHQTAMLVEVAAAESGTFRPRVQALGTVEPARTVSVAAQVAGRVEEVSDAMVPGGRVSAEDVLVALDRDDFRIALATAESALVEAESALQLEEGRASVARFDLEVAGPEVAETDRALVLREPQRASAEARVEAARAAVRRAELDLSRARVRAPFDALVRTRDIEVGGLVSVGESLATLVATDAYWVIAMVSEDMLPWLEFADATDGDPAGGGAVTIRGRGWPEGATYTGRLLRPIGALDTTTRMARVVVEVPAPLDAVGPEGEALPPLLLGAFVEVELEAVPLADVVRVPRGWIRAGDTVWVMSVEDTLSIRSVEVAFEDEEFAYLRSGVAAGERVVTTPLATVREGVALRIDGGTDAANEGSE